MTKEEELFNRWIGLKFDIQFLAGIVQNGVEHITHEDGVEWLNAYERFETELRQIKSATLAILP